MAFWASFSSFFSIDLFLNAIYGNKISKLLGLRVTLINCRYTRQEWELNTYVVNIFALFSQTLLVCPLLAALLELDIT